MPYASELLGRPVRDPTGEVVGRLSDIIVPGDVDYPTVTVAVDRERAGLTGISTQDVARSLVAATSSSRFTEPNYWADPKTGVAYQVQVQIPTQRMESLEEIKNLNVSRSADNPVLLRNVAAVGSGTAVGGLSGTSTPGFAGSSQSQCDNALVGLPVAPVPKCSHPESW